MKRLLLLFFLFLSVSINAQPPAFPPPLSTCDDNNDGFATFDLTSVIPMLLGGMNPATTDFTFYEIQSDAQLGANAITVPNAYVNITPNNQFIYLRIVDNANSEIYYSTFNLIVNSLPSAIITGTSTVCQNSASPVITFTGVGGTLPYTFTYLDPFGSMQTVSSIGSGGSVTIPVPTTTSGLFTYQLLIVNGSGMQSCSQNVSGVAVITVIPSLIANPAHLEFCDMTELPIYNLSNADAQITAGAPDSVVSYHETLADAQTGANPIGPGAYIPSINPGNQTLHARVTNSSLSCFNTTTLTLHTLNCEPCQAPIAIVNSNTNSNSSLINWTSNGTATAWQIIALPAGSASPTAASTGWIETPVNPYLLVGLTSNTSYDVYVRANCYNGLSDWSQPTTVTTLSPPPVCGGTFVDDGGLNDNYPNNSNKTTTICPVVPGDAVTVTFTSFNTEPNWDALYVYDGATVSSSTLIPSINASGNVPGGMPGGYWGNLTGLNLPGPFVASSQTGCLTFVFRSDTSNTLEGWVANVSCNPVICEVPTALTVSSITNTSAVINWINPSLSSEILILPQGSPAPTPNSQGVIVQGNMYVVTNLAPNGCYTVYVRTLCAFNTDWSSPVNFCMFNCENTGNCTESLSLVAFLDTNNNGIKDTGENNFTYGNFVYQVNDSGANQYGTSNDGFYYIFDSNPTNSYDIQFYLQPDLSTYYSSSVVHNNITLPVGSGNNILYFPIVNTQPHVDAWVNLSPQGQPRPGFSYTNIISYQNRGLQTISSGTITFTNQSNVSITSVSQTGTTATPTGFTYNFTNLAPAENRQIYVTFLVPTIPTVTLGDLINNNVAIQIDNDINLSNNSSSFSQAIVGSYDPNDKMESHGGKIVYADFTSNDYLYYTIQFENTGTASAEFIRVEDALDAQLNENTFEMLNASHSVNTKRLGNQLTWHFYNINLPHTSANPTGSHGYISFRIKPKPDYAIGDIIPNYASIYFDYNPPIVTNSFNTEFVQALGSPNFAFNTISLYPNPTNNSVTITNNGTEKISKLVIYEITGKRIYSLDKNELSIISIDVSHFAKGIYLVEMTSENNSKVTKKLIIK